VEGDRCDLCSAGRLRSRQVREYYRTGRRLVVMERVPAYVCDKCGERYYDADVAKRMRQLAKKASRVKERVSFPLVRFGEGRIAYRRAPA
jgi:YgiT-type zinc finger domain-containing protein